MRLAELVRTLSLATDAGTGMPEEHGLRSAALAVRLGEVTGADERTRSDAFYLTLLCYSGCSARADIAARVLGDEVQFMHNPGENDLYMAGPLMGQKYPSDAMPRGFGWRRSRPAAFRNRDVRRGGCRRWWQPRSAPRCCDGA